MSRNIYTAIVPNIVICILNPLKIMHHPLNSRSPSIQVTNLRESLNAKDQLDWIGFNVRKQIYKSNTGQNTGQHATSDTIYWCHKCFHLGLGVIVTASGSCCRHSDVMVLSPCKHQKSANPAEPITYMQPSPGGRGACTCYTQYGYCGQYAYCVCAV